LGAGAFGHVVLAVRTATGERVAIKYLSERLLSDQRFRTEFAVEARLLKELRSPHVVRVEEYVEGPDGAAIVMELVDGISLRQLLKAEGATTPEAALSVLKGSLLGLAAAHEARVVHRDYKPENVLVTAEGRSTLVDFGVAVRAGSTTTAAGTPPYMAPEQWRTGIAGPATDVYAATAVFFECVVGRRPFVAETLPELQAQHALAPVPVEQAPEPVRALIQHGMAKDPADRPVGAAAFVTELEAAAAAAYGSDWEDRGVLALAGLAAALAVLFPLATATVATTATGATSATGGAAAAQGAAQGAAGHTGLSAAPARLGRKGLSKGVKAILTVTAAAAVVAAGGYAYVKASSDSPSSSDRATAAPAAVTTPPNTGSLSPSPTASVAPAALTGTYTFDLKSVKITASLTGQEESLARRVAKQGDGKKVRLQRAPGGGLQLRVGSGAPVKLKRTGPGKFSLTGGATMTVKPEDLQAGRVMSFTVSGPIFIIRGGGPRKTVGKATYVATRS
jgi:serine/threonine-protein kinase